MKTLKYIVAISLSIFFSACKEDFLDRFPQTEISPELFFNTEEDLALYVNGLISYPDRYMYRDDQNTE